jgi:hypothetical protein
MFQLKIQQLIVSFTRINEHSANGHKFNAQCVEQLISMCTFLNMIRPYFGSTGCPNKFSIFYIRMDRLDHKFYAQAEASTIIQFLHKNGDFLSNVLCSFFFFGRQDKHFFFDFQNSVACNFRRGTASRVFDTTGALREQQ